jgi:hypothetical protein
MLRTEPPHPVILRDEGSLLAWLTEESVIREILRFRNRQVCAFFDQRDLPVSPLRMTESEGPDYPAKCHGIYLVENTG